MNINKLFCRDSLKKVFSWERIICRIIAAWCAFAAYTCMGEGKFYEISFAQEVSLSVVALWVLCGFAVLSVVNILLNELETDSWVLFAGATLCVVCWLVSFKDTDRRFFVMLAVAVAYSLFALYFVHRNKILLSKWQPKSGVVTALGIGLALTSGGVIALVTCLRYMTFAAPNFDFGLFCNMFYNMAESGLPLVTSERDVLLSHFVVHVSPIYYLMLPAYYLFPSPMTLQILQAAVLASGVIPVVLLCKKFKLSGKATLVVAFLYAFYPALSGGCFYDLHENCFLTPLLLWVFYFFEKEKYLFMYISAVLVLLVKEDAAIYIILFAVYLMFSRKKPLHGAILATGAVVYFSIACVYLDSMSAYYAEYYATDTPNPAIAGPMVNRFENLMASRDDGLLGAVKTALVNPGYLLTQLFNTSENGWEKLVYALEMFLPLGFLPFCTKKPSRWLLVVPILLNLLTMYKYQYDIGFHYQFGIIAFLVYAMIQNLPELKGEVRRNLLTIAAVLCCSIYLVTASPMINTYVNRWENGKETYTEMEEILDTIPEDASVTCTTFLLAHLADRDIIYQVNYHGVVADVDYVIFDLSRAYDEAMAHKFLTIGYEIEAQYEGKLLILKKAE